MKAWEEWWLRGQSCDKGSMQRMPMPPAVSVQSVPLLAGLGGFHPSRVSMLPSKVLALPTGVFLEMGNKRGCETPLLHPCVLSLWGQQGSTGDTGAITSQVLKKGWKKNQGWKRWKQRKAGWGRAGSGCSPVHQEVVPSPCASRGQGPTSLCREQRSGFSCLPLPGKNTAGLTLLIPLPNSAVLGAILGWQCELCEKKCRGTLHCELLLSRCNNGNKIKVLPNDS